jgi:phage regulator Rha-like protein
MNELMLNRKFISSREIAEATGKMHNDVMKDIRVMCTQAEIKITLRGISPEVNNEEVIVISHEIEIEIGNGATRKSKEYLLNEMAAETLALGYDVKRRIKVLQLIKKLKNVIDNRTVQVPKFETPEMLLEAVKMLVENNRKTRELEQRVKAIEERPVINAPIEHFSIMGHCKNIGKQVTLRQSQRLSWKCKTLCNELGLVIGKISDPRFGSVNTYPLDVLKEIIG